MGNEESRERERIYIEQEELFRQVAELRLVQEAEQQARQQVEQRARQQAAQQARLQADQRARQQAEQQARLQAEQQARQSTSYAVGSIDNSFVMVTNNMMTTLSNKNNQRQRLNPGTSTAQASAPSLRDWSESDQDPDFNCPLCGLRFGEQIFQCERGHSACDTCRERGAACQCGAPLTSTRNLLLQAIVIEREVPCLNGCKMSVSLGNMKQHLVHCSLLNNLDCPVATFGKCSWRGKVGQLAAHFDERHPEHRQGCVGKEMLLPGVTCNIRYMHLVPLGPFMFLIHVQVLDDTGKVSLLVQMLGTRAQAAKWVYEWHMYKKSEPRRKVQYTDRCRSVEESARALIVDDDCAVMPVALASTMVDRECVAYKVYIKREDDDPAVKAPRYRGNAKSATRNQS